MESTENKNKAYTLVIRCGKAGGGKGALISEDVAMTLGCSNTQTLFQPIPLALRNRGGGVKR